MNFEKIYRNDWSAVHDLTEVKYIMKTLLVLR